MSYRKRLAIAGKILLSAMGTVLITTLPSFAAETGAGWRPTYDLVMRWVNFIILFAVIFKYARAPIRDFLWGKKIEIASEIEKLETEKKAAEEKLADTKQKMADNEARLVLIRERIVNDGKLKKETLIREAEAEGKRLLDTTRQKISARITNAEEALKQEMVDEAIALALRKLPKEIGGQDEKQLTEQYLTTISSFASTGMDHGKKSVD